MSVSKVKREFTFIWKIENFSMLPHQTGELLRSPVFMVDMWKGIEWYLTIYPRGSDNKDKLSCFLNALTTEKNDFEINFSLTIESTNSSIEITMEGVFPVKTTGLGWHFNSLTEIYAKKYLYLPQDILSVRCHLTPKDSNDELTLSSSIECATSFLDKVKISRSGIRVQQRSITCIIQKVGTHREPVEMSLNETMEDCPGMKMKLNFCEIVNNINIPIEIQQTAAAPLDEKQERLFVKCKISVVGVNKEYQDSKEDTYLYESSLYDVWHFPLFLKTSNLARGKYLNQEDTLVLQCDFVFSYKSGVYHWDVSDGPFAFGSREIDEADNWCTSVQSLCASGKFTDVQLKAGDETFRTHKLLLCARSSVFDAMFENDMAEKNSGVVKIDDVDPATLKKMLAFINFGEIKEKDVSPEDMCKLYEAADKYNIVSLKSWCAKSLISSLSVEKVCDLLVLADAHHDDFLMTSVRNFICCHEDETFNSEDWECFMQSNLKLSAEVMHKVLLNRK